MVLQSVVSAGGSASTPQVFQGLFPKSFLSYLRTSIWSLEHIIIFQEFLFWIHFLFKEFRFHTLRPSSAANHGMIIEAARIFLSKILVLIRMRMLDTPFIFFSTLNYWSKSYGTILKHKSLDAEPLKWIMNTVWSRSMWAAIFFSFVTY